MGTSNQIRKLIDEDRRALLNRRSDVPGLFFFAAHMSALLLTGSIIWLLRGSVYVWPAMFIHGVIIVHLFGPFHEAAHRTAFKTPFLNRIVLWVTALLLMLTPRYFQLEHAVHHAHTQDPERDPQMIPIAESRKGYLWYGTAIPYFYSVSSALFRRPFALFKARELKVVPPNRLHDVQQETWIMWAVYFTVAAISLAFHSWSALEFWLIPRMLGEPVMRFIRMSEHVGRPQVADVLRNTRTVRTVAPLRWLAWNMAYHAEHHALPSAPFHALPDLHLILREHLEDVRPGYIATQIHLLHHAR